MINTRAIGRISRTVSIVAAAALVAGAIAPASAALPDPSSASKQDEAKPEKKATTYCVEYKITGSILPRKTCKTRAQWIEEDGVDPVKVK